MSIFAFRIQNSVSEIHRTVLYSTSPFGTKRFARMLRSEKVRMSRWHGELKEVMKRLDQINIKILTAMWKFGPRNLLEVSRRTRIPFTSVYHRVGKLESEKGRVSYVTPKTSKLGMMRFVVQVTANPGREDKVSKALRIPGYWESICTCEAPFTHHSTHSVPAKYAAEFRKYLRRLSQARLVSQQKVIITGDFYPNFPNFAYYNPTAKEWRFEWNAWVSLVRRRKPTAFIEDPHDYQTIIDKRDLLIVKELQKNARATFAHMAPILGISLQGVKYHFDKKLVPSGIVKQFGFDITQYPHYVAATHAAMLTFTNKQAMNQFYSALGELFFVQGVSKVLRNNALLVRTFIPESQLGSMFDFYSELAKSRILQTYQTIRLNIAGEEVQTVDPELFKNEVGWTWDHRKHSSELSKLR